MPSRREGGFREVWLPPYFSRLLRKNNRNKRIRNQFSNRRAVIPRSTTVDLSELRSLYPDAEKMLSAARQAMGLVGRTPAVWTHNPYGGAPKRAEVHVIEDDEARDPADIAEEELASAVLSLQTALNAAKPGTMIPGQILDETLARLVEGSDWKLISVAAPLHPLPHEGKWLRPICYADRKSVV